MNYYIIGIIVLIIVCIFSYYQIKKNVESFDNYNLISGLHTFMSCENEKYKRVLPPLDLLSDKQKDELMLQLKKLEFFPEKNIAA